MRNGTSAKKKYDMICHLNAVCKKVDGLAVYEPGWDDKAVAAHVGVSINAVQHYRQNGIGPLFLMPKRSPDGLEARVARLEAMMDELLPFGRAK